MLTTVSMKSTKTLKGKWKELRSYELVLYFTTFFCDLHDEIDLDEAEVDSDEAAGCDIAVCPVPGNVAKTRRDAIKHYLSSMASSRM